MVSLLEIIGSINDNINDRDLTLDIGYEALIGLLKWATPINPEKTLSTLVHVLYD